MLQEAQKRQQAFYGRKRTIMDKALELSEMTGAKVTSIVSSLLNTSCIHRTRFVKQ